MYKDDAYAKTHPIEMEFGDGAY